jgi:hypothetical protein
MRIHERTFLTALFVVAALVFVLPANSAAQGDDTGTGTVADGPTIVLNLGRIKHQLALSQAREESDSPLRLEYRLSVYGVAPPIELLRGFDTQNGAVPFGAPTHADFLNHWIPREFRTPAFPLFPLLGWSFGR